MSPLEGSKRPTLSISLPSFGSKSPSSARRSPFNLLPSSPTSTNERNHRELPPPCVSPSLSPSGRPRGFIPPRRWITKRSYPRIAILALLIVLLSSLYHVIPPILDSHATVAQPTDFSRSFEEPDYALITSPQPHSIPCPSTTPTTNGRDPLLLLLGIFSTASEASRDRRQFLRRNNVTTDWPTTGPYRTELRFILGRPPTLRTRFDLFMENWTYGDLALVDCDENIDEGKTAAFLHWAATQRPKGDEPRFVMKTDDDTYLVMPNVLGAFSSMDCPSHRNVYWGTSAGGTHYFDRYFRGLGYALSWPLAKWIGSAGITHAHTLKIEDARTAQWLRMLDQTTDPVEFVDNGWAMGDYNQLDLSVNTMALHFLKWEPEYLETVAAVKKVWSDDGRPFDPASAVPWRDIVDSGQTKPEAAKREKERQKAMGWDV